MKKFLVLLCLLIANPLFGAIAATTHWECRADATAAMVNGGGFNPSNANFMTDLACDANTGNTASPVVSSASYNFVAGDVGAWVYIQSGTNWTPGWYKIASVAANKATLDAAVGNAVIVDNTIVRGVKKSTVAGCGTVATPTGGVFGVDYTQQAAAVVTNTNLTCTAASTTVTSTSSFRKSMIGNVIHLSALTGTGALVGWYEIVNYTDTSNVVLDRTPTNGVNNITAGTFAVGGALDLTNSSNVDGWIDNNSLSSGSSGVVGGNFIWVRGGSYASVGSFAVASTSTTATAPGTMTGYPAATNRGDWAAANPFGTSPTAPVVTLSSGNSWNFQSGCFNMSNIKFVGVAGNVALIQCGTVGGTFHDINVYFVNGAGGAGSGTAFTAPAGGIAYNIEAVCNTGTAYALANYSLNFAIYAHDSLRLFDHTNSARCTLSGSIGIGTYPTSSGSAGMSLGSSSTGNHVNNVTLIGHATPVSGQTGILIAATAADAHITNSIIYGFDTGINGTTSQLKNNRGAFNNIYNCNTAYGSLYTKSTTDLAVNPQFVNFTEIKNTGGTLTSATVLTAASAGQCSTVTDNVDFIYIYSGTNATVGIFPITGHTSNTITSAGSTMRSSAGTNDVVWGVITGRNVAVGSNLRGKGLPGTTAAFTVFPATTNTDIGAVQTGSGSESAASWIK